jgi:hypothetical protein
VARRKQSRHNTGDDAVHETREIRIRTLRALD